MTRRPKLLDLFCCAGGASVGYERAGFEVVGVDVEPQPRYPYEFHQADALTYPLEGFDVIHASPPCQAYSHATAGVDRKRYPDLLEPTRDLLAASGRPYVIENVEGAARLLRHPLRLCGTEFGLRTYDPRAEQVIQLHRHRMFESNLYLHGAGGCQHDARTLVAGAYAGGRHTPDPSRRRTGNPAAGYVPALAVRRDLLGIDWPTNGHETNQAIPPAYTEFLGRQLIEQL